MTAHFLKAALYGCASFCILATAPFMQGEPLRLQVIDRAQHPQVRAVVRIVSLHGNENVVLGNVTTDERGETQVVLHGSWRGRILRIEVVGAGEMSVYKPAGGLFDGSTQSLRVQLVPKGSIALLAPDQIEQNFRSLLAQNHMLMMDLSAMTHRAANVDDAIRTWAENNKFTYKEVDDKIRAWARLAEQDRAHLTRQRKMLTALALRRYDEASRLAAENLQESLARWRQEDDALRKSRIEKLQTLSDDGLQAIDVMVMCDHYPEAYKVVRDMRAEIDRSQRRFPDESEFVTLRIEWIIVSGYVASNAATSVPTEENKAAMQASIVDIQEILLNPEIAGMKSADITHLKIMLGSIELSSMYYQDEKSIQTVDEASKLLTGALAELPASEFDQQAGLAQIQLLVAYILRASLSDPAEQHIWREKSLALRKQIVSSRVYNEDPDLRDMLPIALCSSAAMSSGPDSLKEGLKNCADAAQHSEQQNSFLMAGMFHTMRGFFALDNADDDTPEARELLLEAGKDFDLGKKLFEKSQEESSLALTMNDLGIGFYQMLMARHAPENEKTALMRKAAVTVEQGLAHSVLPEDHVLNLAAHMGLANIYDSLTEDTDGANGVAYATKAVEHYRASYDILKSTQHGKNMSDLLRDYANALCALSDKKQRFFYSRHPNLVGQHGSDADEVQRNALFKEATALLTKAVEIYRLRLTIVSEETEPVKWANTQKYIGDALANMPAVTHDTESARRDYLRAVSTYQIALRYLTPKNSRANWLQVNDRTGNCLQSLGDYFEQDRKVHYEAARDAYLRVLAEADPKKDAAGWIHTQSNLAYVYDNLDNPEAAEKAIDTLLSFHPEDRQMDRLLYEIEHEDLFHFDRAYILARRIYDDDPDYAMQMDLAEAAWTAGKFAECSKLAAKPASAQDAHTARRLRGESDLLRLTCGYALHQQADAAAFDKLAADEALVVPKLWTNKGAQKFVSESDLYSKQRQQWLKLLNAFQLGDREAFKKALHELRGEVTQ